MIDTNIHTQTQHRLINPVRIANVMSITPSAVNEIIHEGTPSANVKVVQMPVTMNRSLNVGIKSLIIRKIPHIILPVEKNIKIFAHLIGSYHK